MQIAIKGYAVSGGGRGIERVDLSADGGKTWKEASRYQKPGIQYVTDDEKCDKWAWVLFEAEADVHSNTEIVAKAVCHLSVYLRDKLFSRQIILTTFVSGGNLDPFTVKLFSFYLQG